MAPVATLFAEALEHHQAGRLPHARRLYQSVLTSDPQHDEALHLLGVLDYQAGDIPSALEHLEQGRSLNSHNAALCGNLGLVYRAAGRLEEAIGSLRQAVSLEDDSGELHGNLGVALLESGEVESAIASFRRATALQPDSPWHWTNLGNALRQRSRHDEALDAYDTALRRDSRFALALLNRGGLKLDLGHLRSAEEDLRRALTISPGMAEAQSNLGNTLRAQGRAAEALAHHREAHRLRPNSPVVFTNLANTLMDLGYVDECQVCYREALRLQPDYPPALTNLGVAAQHQGRLDEALACFRQALDLCPDKDGVRTAYLFCRNYDPESDPQTLFQEHRAWGQRHEHPYRPHDNEANPDRRLRVGYVSADLRGHAVARFVEPIFAQHDPTQVEVYCYADVVNPDATTARLRALVPHWHSTCGLDDASLAEQIRDDRIDLLVDLSGHTSRSRLLAFAHKPAPVQITYLGYPNTTGLSAVDYRLTDEIGDPPDADPLYTETLVRLPRVFCCFAPPAEAPEINSLPALKRGFITFGSPHNLAKLNARVLDLWAEVLRRVGNSRLLLFRGELRGSVCERLQAEFQTRGVDPSRIELRPVSVAEEGYAGYLRAYHEVDLCLDTFPANAGTTACEALWMGVPWVAMSGRSFHGRLSLTLLNSLGMSDWVVESPQDYVALATVRAGDLPALEVERQMLRSRLLASPLCDAVGFTRNLENTYRDLWRRWCLRIRGASEIAQTEERT